jgi:uncharacterized protein YjbJ (UPF0337 family)
MMNSDVLQGKWKQLRGNLKEAFGKLTDDDLTQAEGSTDKMLGALQERYGYSKDQAQNEWEQFVNRYGNDSDQTKSHLRDASDDLKDAARNLKNAAQR